MVKNGKTYCATVCFGRAPTLQPPGSDVSVDIPEGSRGVYVMGVETDFTDFKHVVEKQECFVSPVVEVLHYKDENSTCQELKLHTLRIPHSLQNQDLLHLIRVRQGKSSNGASFEYISNSDVFKGSRNTFSTSDKFITISTSEFSKFVCTSCETTCDGTLKVLLYGNLNTSRNKNLTTVKINSFLCSPLFHIAEFREVGVLARKIYPSSFSIFIFYFNVCYTSLHYFQHLRKVQGEYMFSPLRERSLEVNTKDFDPKDYRIIMKMYPAPTETNSWRPIIQDDSRTEEQGRLLEVKKNLEMMLMLCHSSTK